MSPTLNRFAALLVSVGLAFPAAVSAQQPAPAAAPAQAPAGGGKTFSQQQLDQILAPIALYPDPLLAQILMASTYPLEIVEAARWSKANPNVKDKALEDAMQQQKWDPAVKSLTAFPQVLAMMNEKLDWTQQLGDAFLAQQQDVMKTVQALRKKAHDQGNLKSSKEQTVVVEQVETQTIIKVEPADPQVVYVPTYNPTVIYGAWPYPAYPPYYYYPPGYVAGTAFWSFTAGVIVGSALWGDCNWGRGDVNVNVNRYNSFNRTNISNNNWNHNVEHRKGVAYRDQGVAQKYDRGQSRDAASREQFRGRAEQGRQDLGQQRMDSGRTGNRAGGPSAGTRDVAGDRGGGDRGGAGAGGRDVGGGDRGGAGGGRDMGGGPSAGARDMGGGGRDVSGGSRASGFGGADQGRQASNYSSRGQSSRQSAGGGGGGGAARAPSGGGGGGGRGGGGGGRR
jgi:hypothetical protein